MRALPSPLRKQLESAVLAARRASESAARAALDGLGVFAERRPEHLGADQTALRKGLRAKWRQMGGDDALLVSECAYEQWHRLLFARFLAENQLLLHPQYGAAVTLEDCEELAGDLGEPDGWSVAARFAAEILPGIFRLDDPCVRLRLAPEGRDALERIVAGLPAEVFVADDALGWVYQFWQKNKKDEINASERKIGGADLGPVTQLFTENYMVRFLLENSLGAWWASRHPDSPLVAGFEYLRFDDAGKPAAGAFDGWPARVAEVTMMDPCCGSGHFCVEGFSMLWQMRAEEEGLSPVEAQDAVLRDNLFGLELDPRCVQIAMFAVALQAWKAGGGWRRLPVPNIACSGIPVKAPVEEWKKLAQGDGRLENALVRLHELFRDADTLGSLIDPRRATEFADATGLQRSFEDVDWEGVAPLLAKAVEGERGDPATAVLGADATGIARAADYLSRRYVLIATNVPYLGRGSQGEVLRKWSVSKLPLAEADLATTVTERFAHQSLSCSLILPHNWLFMSTFKNLRSEWLTRLQWCVVARLGAGAFREVTGEVVQVLAWIFQVGRPSKEQYYLEIDAASTVSTERKAEMVRTGKEWYVKQLDQLANAESIIVPGGALKGPYIRDFAEVRAGLTTGDSPAFIRSFWEVCNCQGMWERLQTAPQGSELYSGCSDVILWENERGRLAKFAESVKHMNSATQGWRRGKPLWRRSGVAVKMMGKLTVSPYTGERFDLTTAVIVPKDTDALNAIWHFCKSGEFESTIRRFHSKLSVESGTILNTPIDIDRWRQVAEAAGPLPIPHSPDPTQWLFTGRPETSTAPLQVAVARLLGYRWPEQPEADDLDALADRDGIVCLPSVAGERPAADRLQQVLAQALGGTWTPARAAELLAQAGGKRKNVADWLRDEYWRQHCALFGNRPFIWHIWDGQLDGFAALVNYHRLDRKAMEKLTYTYLGQDWVERQRAEVRDGTAGAEARLTAALGLQRKLEAILHGEAPYDIYVRWKPLHEQALGWDPDLNDGVRLNIRPFVEAGVLRAPFNIHWKKDRGQNPDGSERHNDLHYALAEKAASRARQPGLGGYE